MVKAPWTLSPKSKQLFSERPGSFQNDPAGIFRISGFPAFSVFRHFPDLPGKSLISRSLKISSVRSDFMADLQDEKSRQNKKRIKYGYMWALFCAVFWGMWYLPGTAIWALNPFDVMLEELSISTGDASVSYLTVAILISAFNAVACVAALLLWNAVIGRYKLEELGRTIRSVRHCSKWFFLGGIFGLLAVLGSFMAMGYIGASFSAVAGLLYPVVGATVSRFWYGERVSKRATVGIFLIVFGGIAIYAGGLITELSAGSGVPWFGYIGGIMAAVCWGIEGAVAGKGLDIAEPDSGLTARFIAEGLYYWVIILPVIALCGIPVYKYALQVIQDPLVLVILAFMGITFGYCYVTWYKSFPLIGVGRGQGIGNLYGIFAVVFVILFMGGFPGWALLIGAILCIAGSFLMFSENTENVETLRGGERNGKTADQDPHHRLHERRHRKMEQRHRLRHVCRIQHFNDLCRQPGLHQFQSDRTGRERFPEKHR